MSRLASLIASTALAGCALAIPAASSADVGDDFGLVPGSFFVGACDLPAIDPGVDSPAAQVEKRDCHAESTLAPQTAAPLTQAGAHPDLTTSFEFKPLVNGPPGTGGPYPDGNPKDIVADLPPGLIGNTQAAPACRGSNLAFGECPIASQVGIVELRLSQGDAEGSPANPNCGIRQPIWEELTPTHPHFPQFSFPDGPTDPPTLGTGNFESQEGPSGLGARCRVPLYNVVPAHGEIAALSLTFDTSIIATLRPALRSDGDYGLQVRVQNVPEFPAVSKATTTVWGVPADPAHDPFRWRIGQGGIFEAPGLPPGQSWPAGEPVRPFLHNPTSCAGSQPASLRTRSWQHPDVWHEYEHELPAFTGCEEVPFEPDVSLKPSAERADSPTGLGVELELPQDGIEDPGVLATTALRDVVATLPEGMSINPAGASGQAVCSSERIGLTSDAGELPVTFDKSDPFDGRGEDCPPASKIGTARVDTPLLAPEDALEGEVFLAAPYDNPFDSLLAIYLVARSPERGLVVKLAGETRLDPETGRIAAVFRDSPPLAFSRFALEFKSGPRAPLATPVACGFHRNRTELVPWASTPQAPREVAVEQPEVEVRSAPGGGCPGSAAARPFALGFAAGATNPLAGAHSPFTLRFTRPDGSQEISSLQVRTPEGFSARLRGVPACPEASLALAARRDGRDEQRSPACPAASRVGSTTVGAGAGPEPYYANGVVYLAGPYKGAPLSLAAVVPAVAGPFDLGTVVVRTALRVDPRTAQILAVSDPLPRIVEGIPLRLRDIRVDVDRPAFAINPTDCSEQLVSAMLWGSHGASTNLATRFQVGGCERLDFKPSLELRLFGGVGRGAYQGLRAVVRARPGDANIGRTVVRMPKSAFLAQEHIRTVCTRVQFAADACPKGAVYGKAIAWSPLLGYPLEGNVYLRSSDNPLPDLVADLRGPAHQPIRIELVGRTDSVKSALRNTFDIVPDAPVSHFRLNLFGKQKGLIVNSRNVCRGKNRAAVRMDAQNGRRALLRPVLRNKRCAKLRKKAKGKRPAKRSRAASER